MDKPSPIDSVFNYHERTKHRFDGYAKGPGTIDWEAQPDSFRRFEGAMLRELPLFDPDEGPSFDKLLESASIAEQAWDETTISRLMLFSLGLAAWKQYGPSRWALRCNPSSGNLHPTEGYLVILGVDGFEDGLYHYRPDEHALELRCRYGDSMNYDQPTVFLGLSSIHWREAWKYGERAYRYCQLDLGHAVAALDYCATTLGKKVMPLLEVGTDTARRLLGLDRLGEFHVDETEHADVLLAVQGSETVDSKLIPTLIESLPNGEWFGRANRLDPQHFYQWPVIDEVSHATRRPPGSAASPAERCWPEPLPAADHPLSNQSIYRLFRQRRSAQAFDPSSRLTEEEFYRLLDRSLPRHILAPWSAQDWPTRIHLVLFVHNVENLDPGLYLLARRQDAADQLKRQLRADLSWESVESAPDHLPLFNLAKAKARTAAKQLGCHQDIAADSAFSLSMLAEFDAVLKDAPWRYDELFWEAGMIGQVLYLEAEAIGQRGTGIGCFFDDGMHELLGVNGKALQAVYHFTVGTPLTDMRLATLPPYSQNG